MQSFRRLKRMSKESEERKQEIEKICVEADEEKATLSKKLKSLSLKCSRKDKVIEVREYLWKRWDQGLIRGLAETRLVAPRASITVLQSWKCYDLYKTLLLYFSEWKGSSRWLAENCWGESWVRINVRYWPCQRRGKEGLCSGAVIFGSMGAQCVWDYFWHLVFFFAFWKQLQNILTILFTRIFNFPFIYQNEKAIQNELKKWVDSYHLWRMKMDFSCFSPFHFSYKEWWSDKTFRYAGLFSDKVHIELSITFYFSWIYRENNTVKSELKKLQNEVESLSQQNHFLQEEVSLVLISLIVKKKIVSIWLFSVRQ